MLCLATDLCSVSTNVNIKLLLHQSFCHFENVFASFPYAVHVGVTNESMVKIDSELHMIPLLLIKFEILLSLSRWIKVQSLPQYNLHSWISSKRAHQLLLVNMWYWCDQMFVTEEWPSFQITYLNKIDFWFKSQTDLAGIYTKKVIQWIKLMNQTEQTCLSNDLM